METTPLSQEGSIEQELETKKGGGNGCLRDRMKFRLCVHSAEGAAGQTTSSRSTLSGNKASSVYLTSTQKGHREGEKQLLEEESETKKEQGAVLTCSCQCEKCTREEEQGEGEQGPEEDREAARSMFAV